MMTVSAAVRLIPKPPARVESRNTPYSGSVLNRSICVLRSCHCTDPSMRQTLKFPPLCSKKLSMRSSMRVICEKMSTLCPFARSLVISRSNRRNLPHCSTSSSALGNMMDPSKPPVIKSGWLQFFRNCMSMLFKAVAPTGAEPPESFCNISPMVLSTSASLNFFCVSTMCAYSTISFFRGKFVSTSPFSRRNRNGFKMPCSFSTTLTRFEASSSVAFSLSLVSKSNHP
mmetsp:Transcript_15186/g.65028  ORF Transcript_15186/g.65028 Transcript_15186/m.65028 type:complete len:228 (-) Transcript_15186:1050-1733(-)